MLIEKTRATFDPILFPLALVEGGKTKTGVVLDFDTKNQMVETNQVLELYIAEAAEAAVTVVPAVAEEATLEVTTAPTKSGNITVAGVTITLDKDVQTTQAKTAAAIAAADFSEAGWEAVQGEDADEAKVFFVATEAGVKTDLAFAAGDTSAVATATTTKQGSAGSSTTHAPKLQVKIMTGDDVESLAVVQSSEVFDVADLVEGFVVYKAALPDKCGRYVRVDLVGTVADNDFGGGLIAGVVRPL
jgi:hypothetical protein